MESVSEVLCASRRLRSLGKAQESLKTVKTLSTRCLTPQEKREIAAEKFDILYAQGFCRTAETVLRKAIAVSSIELVQRKLEEEIWMHAVLKAKRVLVMLHTTGKMDNLMQMRRELVELFLDRYHGPRNAVLVELECVCAEILRNAAALPWAKPEYRKERSNLPSKLEILLEGLITEERCDLALRVAKIYISVHPNSYPLVEKLLLMNTIRPQDKGSLLLELARKTNEIQSYFLGDVYLAKAEEQFSICSHAIGAMEVQFLVLSRRNQDPTDVSDKLRSLSEQFYAMRYRVHTLLALRSLSNFARNHAERRGQALVFQERIRRIAYEIGSRLFWTLAQGAFIPLLGFSNPEAVLNIIESEDILNPKLMIPIPREKFQLCHIISLHYRSVKNRPTEAHWAAMALRFARETGQRVMISRATRRYLQAVSNISVPEEDRLQNDSNLRKVWLLAIDKAGDEFLIEEQFNLYWDLLQVRYRCLSNDLKEVLEKAQSLAEMLAECGNTVYLGEISAMRGDVTVGLNDFEGAMDCYQRTSEMYTALNMRLELSFTLNKIGLLHAQWWNYKRIKDGILDGVQLHTALEYFNSALVMFQEQGRWSQVATCYYRMGVTWNEHIQYVDSSSKGVVENCLECFAKASFHRERIRSEITAAPKSLRDKQLLRSDDSEISDKAIMLCFSQGQFERAWNWIQISKGRTLSDMLGIGFVIPEYLREKIESTEETSQLLAQETGLTERLDKPGENSFALRQDLENLRNQMRGFPPLAELLSLREGQPETLQTLDWFFSTEKEATLVDWVFMEDKVYITTVNTERNVKMEEVKNDVNLHEWVEDYVSEEKERIKIPSDVASPLRMIDYLVEPLARLTKPGCLLVFSPSGPLYSIPLHALQLPSKQLVIERNPIVYSVNMSVLHQCLLRSTRGHSTEEFVAMGFYPDSTNEQKKVTENNEKIANRFGGISISSEDVVEGSFQKHVEKASIFHFHGHAVPDDDGNILDQYLKLFIPDNNESASPITPLATSNSPPNNGFDDMNDMEEVEYIPPGFTVREILSLKLKAPLVTLMACESAKQEISPGDDPMGLVSAFLISGASSVVGTLWSVQSTDGRTFAELFYQELQQQCFGNPKRGLMDLALATQRAVLTMRENPDTRAVYHWAPFVLHGSWKLKPLK